MLPLLIVVFICVPIVELYAIWQVGDAIGILPTIGLLILDSLIGTLLLRAQGRAAWQRFNATTAQGRIPAREVLDGVLVIFGGALLLTPGFVTDFFGLLFLIPPTRAVVRRVLVRHYGSRMVRSATEAAGARMGGRPGTARRGPVGDYDVEGTATELGPRERLPRA